MENRHFYFLYKLRISARHSPLHREIRRNGAGQGNNGTNTFLKFISYGADTFLKFIPYGAIGMISGRSGMPHNTLRTSQERKRYMNKSVRGQHFFQNKMCQMSYAHDSKCAVFSGSWRMFKVPPNTIIIRLKKFYIAPKFNNPLKNSKNDGVLKEHSGAPARYFLRKLTKMCFPWHRIW